MATNGTWYCLIDGEEIGPLNADQVKKLASAGTLSSTHKIRKNGEDWKDVSDIESLAKLIAKQRSSVKQNSNEEESSDEEESSTSEFPEWIPHSLVVYCLVLSYSTLALCIILVPYICWESGIRIEFGALGIAVIVPFRMMLTKFRDGLLSGKREDYWIATGFSILGCFMGILAGLGLMFGEGKWLIGIAVLIVTYLVSGIWLQFAVKLRTNYLSQPEE